MSAKVRRITRNALMGALLAVLQVGLSSIPNTELVTPVLICYTLVFGAEAFAAALVFAGVEILIWGVGIWNIMYLYIWPVLVALVLLSKKLTAGRAGQVWYGVLAGLYGLAFGAMCTIPYLVLSPGTAFAWWLAGLRFDLWHGFCNLVLTILLFRPVTAVLQKVQTFSF